MHLMVQHGNTQIHHPPFCVLCVCCDFSSSRRQVTPSSNHRTYFSAINQDIHSLVMSTDLHSPASFDSALHNNNNGQSLSATPLKPTMMFTSPVSQGVLCVVCADIVVSAVISIQCGHTTCATCASVSCPVDGLPLTPNIPNLALRHHVNDIIIVCPYATVISSDQAEKGSQVAKPLPSSPLRSLDQPHSPSIKRSASSVSNQSRVTLSKGSHASRRVFNIKGEDLGQLDPSGCTAEYKIGSRANHEDTCPYAPIVCPNSAACGSIQRSALADHLDICPYFTCGHQSSGCGFQNTRAVVKSHEDKCSFSSTLNDNQAQHIHILRQQCDVISQLAESLDHRLSKLESTQNRLNALLQQCTTTLGSIAPGI